MRSEMAQPCIGPPPRVRRMRRSRVPWRRSRRLDRAMVSDGYTNVGALVSNVNIKGNWNHHPLWLGRRRGLWGSGIERREMRRFCPHQVAALLMPVVRCTFGVSSDQMDRFPTSELPLRGRAGRRAGAEGEVSDTHRTSDVTPSGTEGAYTRIRP